MKPPIPPHIGNVDEYIDLHPVDTVKTLTNNEHLLGSPFFYDAERMNCHEGTSSTFDKVLPLNVHKESSDRSPTSRGSKQRRDYDDDNDDNDGDDGDESGGLGTHALLSLRSNDTRMENTQPNMNYSEIFSKSRSFRVTPLRLETLEKFSAAPTVYLRNSSLFKEPCTPHSAKSWESQDHPNDLSDFSNSAKVLSLSSPPSLSHSLRSSNPDAIQALEKMRHKHNCIRELYNTEWQFAQDMAVVVRIYVCGSAGVGLSVREIDTLFTNIFEVLDISLCTVAILEANIPRQILHGEGTLGHLDILADREIQIGRAMCIVLTGHLYEIYEHYIHRNKEQMQLYHKLTHRMNEELCNNDSNKYANGGSEYINEKKSQIDMRKLKSWLDCCKMRASKFTTAWALDCLLIKPIQRLGKYPLFLKTILECSNSEDEGYQEIERAYKRSKHYLDCVNTRFG